MSKDQCEITCKLRILQHAEETGHVAKTCRYFGVGRSSFYRRRDAYAECRRKYVREEVLDQAFANLLDQLHFNEVAALKASHADERREHEQAIHRSQVEYKRSEDRLHAMYLDKLDGRIDNAFHDRMSAQWRTEQTRPLREIERMVALRNHIWAMASAFWNWREMPAGCL